MHLALPVLMLLHGVAHVPGVLTSWRLATFPELPYHTNLLGGRLDVGDAGMRMVGALWLAAGLGFVLSAAAAAIRYEHWMMLALASALLSTALCTLEYSAARLGLWTNVVVLLALALAAIVPGR